MILHFECFMCPEELDATVETAHLLSMEEAPKAAKGIHQHSYQNSVMNVEPNTLLSLQNSAVNVEFEGWLCEQVL